MLRSLSPRAELLIVNLICFGPFTARSIVGLAERKTSFLFDDRGALTLLAIEVVCGALALLLLRARGWTPAALGLHVTMRQTIGGMLLLIGVYIFIGGFYELVRAATNSDPGAGTTFHAQLSWPVLLALTLVNPLYDELLLVAYNLEAAKASGPAFAITLSAAVRFVCHLEQGPIAAVTILPLGLIFALVYWRWRVVWPLVIAHAVMDFMGYVAELP
jgi:membrane protease YdiL (CAAX protease family)